jgi:hypothetical protein
MLTQQLRCVRSLENEAVSVFEVYSTLRTITIRQLYATPDGLEIVKLPRNSIGSLPQNRLHLTGGSESRHPQISWSDRKSLRSHFGQWCRLCEETPCFLGNIDLARRPFDPDYSMATFAQLG